MKIIKVCKNDKTRYFSNMMRVSEFLETRHSNVLYAVKNDKEINGYKIGYIYKGIDISQINNDIEYTNI